MPTIGFELVGDVVVLVNGRENPADAEWAAFCDFIDGQMLSGLKARCLVSTTGGAPTPSQRSRLEKSLALAKGDERIAVLTDSTFARGVVNAFAVLRPGYRALPGDAIEPALAYLGSRVVSATEVRSVMRRLAAGLTTG